MCFKCDVTSGTITKPPIDKISQVCENRQIYLYVYLGYYDEFLNRVFCICLRMMPIMCNYFRKKNDSQAGMAL